MADKVLNFDIKINGKQIDVTKMSMKDFSKIVNQAKKDLKDLPLNDPRYKVLNSEIKNAEKTWKDWRKSIGETGEELDDNQEKVTSYSRQIKALELDLIKVEKQFGKNSKEAADLRTQIAELRGEQENLKNTTRDLDDSLAAIPGPIGKIGQAMGSFEQITRNAKSAMGQLTQQFPILKNAIAATGIGALVIVIGLIVAAIMKAAKSFKPLQDAFAGLSDAVGNVLEAIRPFAEFLIGVFVGAINIASKAINGLLSAFGFATDSFAKNTLQLERSLKNSKDNLEIYGNFYSEWAKKLNEFEDKQAERRKAINEDETLNAEEKRLRLKEINDNEIDDIKLLVIEKGKLLSKAGLDRNKNQLLANNQYIDNERLSNKENIAIQKSYDESIINLDIQASKDRKQIAENRIASLQKISNQGSELEQQRRKSAILDLKQTVEDEKTLIDNLEKDKKAIISLSNAELDKLNREQNRENIALVKARSIEILQISADLIKEENQRNLESAKVSLENIKEQNRKELEEAKLSGVSQEKLKEVQDARIKQANEKIRLAQIQSNAYQIQLEIDKNNRLMIESGVGTQEYFDARENIIQEEFKKELLLADGNTNEQLNARNKYWKSILELDKEKLQSQLTQIQAQYDAQYDNSFGFFQSQRDLENKQYELQQKEYQLNFEMLDIIRAQHDKKMKMIDVAELQYYSDLYQRKADTEIKTIKKQFDDRKTAEDLSYAARIKAAGDNVVEIEQIEREHAQNIKNIQNEKIQAYAAVATAMLDGFANVANALAAVYEAEANNEKKTAAERKKAFEKNKTFQIATASLSAASGIIQILAQPSTLPSPFDWIVKIANAAALGIMTAVQIAKIKNTKFEGGGGSESSSNQLGRNYEEGGLIGGRRHAQGGTLIEAEQGEAIMTRGAVSAFLPMLSMMNQMGGGTSFLPNVGGASYDAPNITKPNEQPIIVKSYVVSKDMETEMEKQSRLKDLSTL